MHFSKKALALAAIAVLSCSPLMADWDPGDSYKMLYPQLPDPNGWDIAFSPGLADDFLCTETGPISDIHFWFSAKDDLPFTVQAIHAYLYSDIPANVSPSGFSVPGDLLWQSHFVNGDGSFNIRQYGDPSSQGWYYANWSNGAFPNNHEITWQANITRIDQPFVQTEDTIYWLSLSMEAVDPTGQTPVELGWKTSLNHWNDKAVWYHQASPVLGGWDALYDPLLVPAAPLDLAFVITPEPGTLSLLAAAGASLLALAWRRRRVS